MEEPRLPSLTEGRIGVLEDSVKSTIHFKVATSVKDGLKMVQNGYTSVDFSGLKVTDETANSLGELLRENFTLKALDLTQTNLSVRAIEAIVEPLLQENRTLIHLNLNRNSLGGGGGKVVANLIEHNRSLTSICLSHTRLGNEGGRAIQLATKKNNSLLSLNVWFSEILDEKINHKIKNYMKRNQKLYKRIWKDIFSDNETLVQWRQAKLMIVGERGSGKTSFVDTLLGRPTSGLLHRDKRDIYVNSSPPMSFSGRRLGSYDNSMNDRSALSVHRSGTMATNSRSWFTRMKSAELSRRLPENSRPNKLLVKNFSFAGEAAAAKSLEIIQERFSTLKDKDKILKKPKSFVFASIRASGKNAKVSNNPGDPAESRKSLIRKKIKEEQSKLKADFDPLLCIKAQVDHERINYSIFDYGGGNVFASVHHLFLTENTMYVVAFNIENLLCEEGSETRVQKALAELKFWLNSIKLHAENSPIFLLGTHLEAVSSTMKKDRVRDSRNIRGWVPSSAYGSKDTVQLPNKKILKDVSELLEKELQLTENFPSLLYNSNLEINYFPISNETHIGIEDIRQTIIDNTLELSVLTEKIPIKWLKLLDYVYGECYKRNGENWVSMNTLHILCQRFGISRLGSLLRWFTQVGVLMYFDQSESLKEMIVVKPEWLMEKFSKLFSKITLLAQQPSRGPAISPRRSIRRKNSNHRRRKEFDLFNPPSAFTLAETRMLRVDKELLQEWSNLKRNGVVTRDLLEFLWGYNLHSYPVATRRLKKSPTNLSFGEPNFSFLSLGSMQSEGSLEPSKSDIGDDKTVFGVKTKRMQAVEKAEHEVEFLIELMQKLLLLNELDSELSKVESKTSATLVRSKAVPEAGRNGVVRRNSVQSQASIAFSISNPKKGYYLVPSLVTNYDNFYLLEPLREGYFDVSLFTQGRIIDLFILFDFTGSFYPLGFFERYLSMTIHYATTLRKTNPVVVNNGKPNLDFQIHEDELTVTGTNIIVKVVNFSFDFDENVRIYIGQTSSQLYTKILLNDKEDETKRAVLEDSIGTLQAIVRKVNEDFMTGGLEWATFIGRNLDDDATFSMLTPIQSDDANEAKSRRETRLGSLVQLDKFIGT